jgi:hypothetical protein
MSTLHMDQFMADSMVETAIAFCSSKKFAGERDQVLEALRGGRCDVCDYLAFSLVRQIGEYLGKLDYTVKAVYLFEPEKASLSLTAPPRTSRRRASGINMLAWVDRRSAALGVLTSTLETMLTESRRKIGCPNAVPACYNLNVHMVDDHEVQDGIGYGAIVQSMYVRSVQIWSRIDQYEQMGIEILGERTHTSDGLNITFSPELAPEEMLLEQALFIEKMPVEARRPLEARLREEKVVLIRKLISDQTGYINVAKEWFTAADLLKIRRRKIGPGKIGGKAAGLLLAASIIEQAGSEELRTSVITPESYFLGSDLIYTFMSANRLTHWNEQKYKEPDQIWAEYPRICSEFAEGEFTPDITERLQELLDDIGPRPVIVRSSSQLEDSFGTSFAGKYNSFFCPNQGCPQENLQDLTRAIARTFASTLRPDALLYRRSKGLQDYDERMAVLIQAVQGQTLGPYYLPFAAGVAFSRNLYRWSPEIRREDGFLRLVWGLGTRAVERVGNDYPRLVALSHPNLQPDDSPEALRRYSQQFVDVIDLRENCFKTLPIGEVLAPEYPTMRYLAQIEQEGYYTPIRSRVSRADLSRLVITFSECLRRTNFASTMSAMLRLLEEYYHGAVDLEFTLSIPEPQALQPKVCITLLQCRPQSHIKPVKVVRIPENIPEERYIFSTQFMVPLGYVSGIRYVIFVAPEAYFRLDTNSERAELGRVIGRLNSLLPPKSFICVGPGRWGTANPDLGVFVAYSDIFNAAALVELSGEGVGHGPEPSLGTHFFQDLMEAEIYPLALMLGSSETKFNNNFFYHTPNHLGKFIEEADPLCDCLRLIDVEDGCPGMRIELIMDDEQGQALAFLSKPGPESV